MSVRIHGAQTGTKRNPTVTLTMSMTDGEKLMYICRFTTIIAESMEFLGMKHRRIVAVLDGLKRSLEQAGVRG